MLLVLEGPIVDCATLGRDVFTLCLLSPEAHRPRPEADLRRCTCHGRSAEHLCQNSHLILEINN